MDRVFRRQGLDPAAVSPLERLAWLGVRTMGALTYHPPQETEYSDRLIDLHEVGKNARQILSGEAAEVLPALMRAGGSPGGARPKVLIGLKGDQIISGEDDLPDGFAHWMVKFSAKADLRDAGPIEFAYAEMARAAGIDFPETRLFKVAKGTSYFGVRRFDRGVGNTRLHMHTFGNLIHANFRVPSTDYADLMKVARALTRNYQDLLRVFRRMLFNIAAHNRDDHAKNFAFVMNSSGEWALSPSYDLGFATGPGGEHTMTILGEGLAPARSHAMQLAAKFDVKQSDAAAIIDQVNAAVAKWRDFAEAAGCTKGSAREIAARIRPL
jgi:serine/threonine-protein kinase HipA